MIYELRTEFLYDDKSQIDVVEEKTLLKYLKSLKRESIAIDIETCFSYKKDREYKMSKKLMSGLNAFDHKILYIQIGTLDRQFILDMRYIAYAQPLLLDINEIIEKNNLTITGHNLIYDLHWLKVHYKFDTRNIKLFDTMIAEKIITNGKYPQIAGYYGLADLYKRYFDIDINSNQLSLFEPKAPKKVRDSFPLITEEPSTIVHLTYCRYDIIIPLRLKTAIESTKEYKFSAKTVKLEFELIKVLTEMKVTGIKLNFDKWNAALSISAKALLDIKKHLSTIKDINWNSPKQKLEAYEALGVKLMNYKGKASSAIEVLKTIANTLDEDTNTITDLLLKHGALSKQVNAYGNKFLRYINKTTGNIHTDIQQLKITGRISSTGPK